MSTVKFALKIPAAPADLSCMDTIDAVFEWMMLEWEMDESAEGREALARYYVAEMPQWEKEGRI